jgi:hypothetical protein
MSEVFKLDSSCERGWYSSYFGDGEGNYGGEVPWAKKFLGDGETKPEHQGGLFGVLPYAIIYWTGTELQQDKS